MIKQAISKKAILRRIDNIEYMSTITFVLLILSMLLGIFTGRIQFLLCSILLLILTILIEIQRWYFISKYNHLYVYSNPHVRNKMKELNDKNK